MIFTKLKTEDYLTYADSVIKNILTEGQTVIVKAETYDQFELNLKFNESKVIQSSGDFPERVEVAQKIKLKNGKLRLILFNDDNELFFEIEYSSCNDI